MTTTEARVATLRAEVVAKYAASAEAQRNHLFGIANTSAFDYAERLLNATEAMRAYMAEIAAIEAEAKVAATTGTKFGGPSVSVVATTAPDSHAPPPARPKQIRVTSDRFAEPNTKGAIVVPIEWDERGAPIVLGIKGMLLSLYAGEWVPADDPEGEEAREREARASLPTLSPREGGATSFTEEDA